MKNNRLGLMALFSLLSLPMSAYCEAPVVDDSQNFAMFEDQALNADQPTSDEEVPLAKDNEEPHQGQSATATSENNATLLDKIHGLRQEIQELRGQLDVQANTIKQLQQQQLSFYKDIDARLSGPKAQLSQTPPPTEPLSLDSENPTPAPPKESMHLSRGNPADEQLSYLAAYDLVKDKRFDEALTAMQRFVTRFPQGGYTANAHYWLGELHMVKKNYSQAISQFETVLKNFPASSKTAACTLKIGYALAASGKEAEARARLQQVLKNYPDTPTAQLAATKLQSLTTT